MAVTRVTGLTELRRKLNSLGREARGIALRGTLAGAEVIRLEAGRQAPRGFSGRLKRSMVKENLPKRRSRGRFLKLGGDVAVFVGPSKKAFYGLFVHQGARTGRGRTRANPFLRRAFDRRRKEAVRTARRHMGREIVQQARRLATR